MRDLTFLFIVLFGLCLLSRSVEARGGRGRGSFGGFFGSWRRSKPKSTNTLFSSRTNHKPVNPYMPPPKPVSIPHQKITKKHQGTNTHFQNTYPHFTGTHLGSNAAVTHYTNTAKIPMGAVYVPHAPSYVQASSSSGLSDFLTGYVTGRLLSHSNHAHYHHAHHYYPKSTGQQVVVIENGNAVQNASEKNFWPTDELVPLASFNSSLTSLEDQTPTVDPIFKYASAPKLDLTTTSPVQIEQENTNLNATEQTPPGGIICMPMKFNESNANNSANIIQVEKIVCFPAPPPPETDKSSDCAMRFFVEPDPNNPAETINIPRWHCNPTTTERPRLVIGDILSMDNDPEALVSRFFHI